MQRARCVAVVIGMIVHGAGCTGGGSAGPSPLPDVTPIDTRPTEASPPDEGVPPPSQGPRDAAGGQEEPPFEGTTGMSERQRPGIKPVVLRDVRVARNEGYERVVFELAGDGLPGYRVEYLGGPAKHCGSGKPVEVAGKAWLAVGLVPAQAHDEAGKVTVKEREMKVKLDRIQEVELTCDFEAHVDWVLGLGERRPYRVLELSSPPRIVIDIQD